MCFHVVVLLTALLVFRRKRRLAKEEQQAAAAAEKKLVDEQERNDDELHEPFECAVPPTAALSPCGRPTRAINECAPYGDDDVEDAAAYFEPCDAADEEESSVVEAGAVSAAVAAASDPTVFFEAVGDDDDDDADRTDAAPHPAVDVRAAFDAKHPDYWGKFEDALAANDAALCELSNASRSELAETLIASEIANAFHRPALVDALLTYFEDCAAAGIPPDGALPPPPDLTADAGTDGGTVVSACEEVVAVECAVGYDADFDFADFETNASNVEEEPVNEALTRRPLHRAMELVKFPVYSLRAVNFGFLGVTYLSIRLHTNPQPTPLERAVGLLGLLYTLAMVLLYHWGARKATREAARAVDELDPADDAPTPPSTPPAPSPFDFAAHDAAPSTPEDGDANGGTCGAHVDDDVMFVGRCLSCDVLETQFEGRLRWVRLDRVRAHYPCALSVLFPRGYWDGPDEIALWYGEFLDMLAARHSHWTGSLHLFKSVLLAALAAQHGLTQSECRAVYWAAFGVLALYPADADGESRTPLGHQRCDDDGRRHAARADYVPGSQRRDRRRKEEDRQLSPGGGAVQRPQPHQRRASGGDGPGKARFEAAGHHAFVPKPRAGQERETQGRRHR